MRTHLVLLALLCGSGGITTASLAEAKPETAWIRDGIRTCTLEENLREVKCAQYHQVIEHHLKPGETWSEYRWMWKAANGAEVRYVSRIGMVGVSNFTIGELYDPASKLPGHRSRNAVSYSPNRELLVIGVPGEGYEFSVKGGT